MAKGLFCSKKIQVTQKTLKKFRWPKACFGQWSGDQRNSDKKRMSVANCWINQGLIRSVAKDRDQMWLWYQMEWTMFIYCKTIQQKDNKQKSIKDKIYNSE